MILTGGIGVGGPLVTVGLGYGFGLSTESVSTPTGAGSNKHRRIHPRYIYEREEDEPVAVAAPKKKNPVVVEIPISDFVAPEFNFQAAAKRIVDSDEDDIEVLLLTLH